MSRRHNKRRRQARKVRAVERARAWEEQRGTLPPGQVIRHMAINGFWLRGGCGFRIQFEDGPPRPGNDGLPPRTLAKRVIWVYADGTEKVLWEAPNLLAPEDLQRHLPGDPEHHQPQASRHHEPRAAQRREPRAAQRRRPRAHSSTATRSHTGLRGRWGGGA